MRARKFDGSAMRPPLVFLLFFCDRALYAATPFQSRKAVISWFAETLLVNTPAEASNPDPLKAASSEFLMNVSVALLDLAMPIVRDEAKFKKVQQYTLFCPLFSNMLCWLCQHDYCGGDRDVFCSC